MTAIMKRSPIDLKQHGWTLGVWILLFALLAYYSTLIPNFGSFQVTSISKNSLPFVYLAIAQAIIVIAGGIDLSIGSLMVLATAISARTMEERSFVLTLVLSVLIIAGLGVLNAGVGWIIAISSVPDIVVTLATSFIWGGVALFVLPSPGGGTAAGFRNLFTGSESGIGSNYINSLIMLAIPMVAVAYFMRRRRTGLSIYATGSDKNAAYLSGVDVDRAKIVAYGLGGAMAAMAGLATLAIVGLGTVTGTNAGAATLSSVAAIVLGGVALTGGVGSVVGASAAAIILFFLNSILVAKNVDSSTAEVMEGALIVIVMMVAGFLEFKRQRSA